MDRSRFGSPVNRRDPHQNVLRIRLRILDEKIEIAAFAKGSGINQLVFGFLFRPASILLNELSVRKCVLRIFVEGFQVGMGWSRIKVVIDLLDVFAVVSLAVRQAEQSLLQNRVFSVPDHEGQTNALMSVAESADPVLAPAIGATSRLIVREIIPGGSIWAVILTHSSPLAFT